MIPELVKIETWGELVEAIEKAGVTPETKINFIDMMGGDKVMIKQDSIGLVIA